MFHVSISPVSVVAAPPPPALLVLFGSVTKSNARQLSSGLQFLQLANAELFQLDVGQHTVASTLPAGRWHLTRGMSWRLLLPALLVTARHATTARTTQLDQPPPQPPPLPPLSNDPATNPCASSYYNHPLPPPSTSYSWTNADSRLTRILRTAILTLVHGLCALHQQLNTVHTHNLPALQHLILHRPPHTALLTLSNHTSTLDDPYIITALIPLPTLLSPLSRHAWCADDVCFKRAAYGPFFRLGRIFPVRRFGGAGLYQPGMEEALSYMVEGGWMHVRTAATSARILP